MTDTEPLLPEQNRAGLPAEPSATADTAKPAPGPDKLYALLDEAGVLAGYSHDPGHSTGSGRRVEVPVGCDLQVGKYEYREGRFSPILAVWKLARKGAGHDPLLAVWFALCAIRDGETLPPYTLAWIDEYARSIDAADAARLRGEE